MPRLSNWIKSAVVLLAVAVWLALPQQGTAQSPLYKVLDTQIDTKPLQTELSIRDALHYLQDRLGTLKNPMELPVLIDTDVFRGEVPDLYPTADSFFELKVKFPAVPSRMTVAAALRIMLKSFPSKNATYVVMPDHVLVTTYNATSAPAKLCEKVRGVFDKKPLHAALRELSEAAGTSIIVDNRATEQAKTVVSATFLNDIDLAVLCES